MTTPLLAVVIGALYAAAVYVLLRPSLLRLVVGLILLGHAGNLLVFTAAGLTRARPPILEPGTTAVAGAVADPLPQALILTAIVINFASVAFVLALAYRTLRALGTDDTDRMRATDR